MSRCAIDTGGGSRISPGGQRAAQLVPAVPVRLGDLLVVHLDLELARGPDARKPSIRLCGIGHGWLPTYRDPG